MKRSFLIYLLLFSILSIAAADAKTAKPKTIAHRGYWKTDNSAQNSMASFIKAQNIGVYGSELDVWLTTDGKVILNHDGVINGVKIQDATYAQVKDMLLENGETMPLLSDILEQAKKNTKVKPIIEIKTHSTAERNRAVAAAVAKLVTDAKAGKYVEFIAFDFGICAELARLLPGEEIAYLASGTSSYSLDEIKAAGITGIDYHYGLLRAHPEYVTEAHAKGMTVNVWTVNNEADMAEMAALGVDFITTDEPATTLKLKAQTVKEAPSAKKIALASPDKKLTVNVYLGDTLQYEVYQSGIQILSRSTISLTLGDGTVYGAKPKLLSSSQRAINQTFDAVIYKKNKVEDVCNELTMKFDGGYSLLFRAYNDGMAYRFVSEAAQPFTVRSEQAEFNFPANRYGYFAYTNTSEDVPLDKQYFNSFEQPYNHIQLSKWNRKRLGITPVLLETTGGRKVVITEADLLNYPGMFLYPGKTDGLKGVFAPYPKKETQGGHNRLQMLVDSREEFIAKFERGEALPWRIVIVSEHDKDLLNSDMVYKLATPPEGDYSWVKPGKVAWDWWNDWNLRDVDFRSGVNNETYKYYIDFASKFGIEYVILDEGWAVNKRADLFQVVPEIDLPMLAAYAKSKNVGLILWAGYWAFDRDMERVCKHYSEMGIKGFKVDFMDRDDQKMVDFYHRAAKMAAKYRVMLDFHGAYKPTGLHRTYPNVVNFEGVNGLEQLKWASNLDQPQYDCIIPFIRQVAGPMDYTQGAMHNATKTNFKPVNNEPMSQGTRCHQLAEYVIFESPLNMLCDNPSNYLAEPDVAQFIASLPTVWDETVAIAGEVGRYVATARRKGDVWYVGALTDWDARTLTLDLSFITAAGYTKGLVYKDGANADRTARDYRREQVALPADGKVPVSLAPGGGWIIKITK